LVTSAFAGETRRTTIVEGKLRPMRSLFKILGILFAASVVAGAATLMGAAVPAGASGTSIWSVQTTVNPEATQVNNSFFTAVSASGPDEAWAVGTYEDKNALEHPLAEHWNGTAWTRMSLPVPTGQQATLGGVDDLGPDNTWAVGLSTGSAGQLTLIEHWNGKTWSIVPSPSPSTGVPGDSNTLDAIGGTGADNLWAAGWDTNEDTDTLALLFEEWNGTTWTAAPSPTPGGSFQIANAITAISPDDVWAAGEDLTDGSATLAAHWNGKKWSIVPTPNITGAGGHAQNRLTGVSAAGPNDVWASGYAYNITDENFSEPYVLHWNGKSWVMSTVPNLGTEGSSLRAIQVLSPKDIWAVGQEQKNNGSIFTLTEQFNGSTWTISPSPDPGMQGKLFNNSLDSIGSAGDGTLFAVGARETTGQCCLRTLALGTSQG
jgi:hypothetical protein